MQYQLLLMESIFAEHTGFLIEDHMYATDKGKIRVLFQIKRIGSDQVVLEYSKCFNIDSKLSANEKAEETAYEFLVKLIHISLKDL